MKRSIFYSWQSDLPSKENRNLIEDALKRALKAIHRDESEKLEPALDRDTIGISGSPDITDSIFLKITAADIFVADISLINSNDDGKKTANPNVLLELGYAIAQLGWDRIILVQNTFYGGPELLPFDLRGRRVLTYQYSAANDNKSEARGQLQGRLEFALKSSLNSNSTNGSSDRSPSWWGIWKIQSRGGSYGGHLFVRDVCSTGFLFDLDIYSGTHTGQVSGYATIASKDLAYAHIKNSYQDEDGEICFRRIQKGKNWIIKTEETAYCGDHHGMGVSFTGDYESQKNSLSELGMLNELEISRVYNLTGQYFDSLMARFQGIGSAENNDTFVAEVFTGGVRGLYTIMEGILMLDKQGRIWVAYIDEDVVRYFTTEFEWRERLPKTIDSWRSRFKEKQIIFKHDVYIVPKEYP